MSSIFGTGTSALLAFQRALNTVSHNVANANTPGYSRQRVEFASAGGNAFGFGFIGSGAKINGVNRIADQFIFARALDNAAELGRLGQLSGLSNRVDRVLSDDATGLAKPWSNFFDGLQGVSTEPSSVAARQSLLGDANAIANRFRSLDQNFRGMHNEVNDRLGNQVKSVNDLTAEIARLNQEIVRQQASAGGRPPNDLLDTRERLVGELSGLIGVDYALQDDGSMNVFTPGGQALVVGTTALKMATVADPYDPGRLELAVQGRNGPVRLNGSGIGGEIGGLLDFRRDVLDPAQAQLAQLAAGFTHSINAQHRQGVDLDGLPGGDLFRPLTPRVNGHAQNTGGASFQSAIADPGAFNGRAVTLAFDGTNWTATDRGSGAAVPMTGSGTAADPFVVNGVEMVLDGAPAAGDRFALLPANGLASGLEVAITNPNRIAAASPLSGSADLGNLGNAGIGGFQILDPATPGFGTPAQIEFIDANTYTIDGAGPFTYDPEVGIEGPGWRMKLDGDPVAGDRFNVEPRGPGSSDNGNMLVMAGLDDLGLLNGGQTSLNGGIGQLAVFGGAQARQAEYAFQAQGAIGDRLMAEREAVSGVNLDEEAANMMRYQQAYMAAAQLISTADEMFQSLLMAVRR
ncbi:MAG: flagellar hook-associated protein FlgK [Lysobacteraceae bacterium]